MHFISVIIKDRFHIWHLNPQFIVSQAIASIGYENPEVRNLSHITVTSLINLYPPGQNGRYFKDDILHSRE